jgi:hypothetical protein
MLVEKKMNDTTTVAATPMSDDDLERAIKEREKLDEKIEAMRKERREADLAKVRELCELHGFTATDLRGALKVKGATKTVKKSTRRRKAS